jgi:hypothetical protein
MIRPVPCAALGEDEFYQVLGEPLIAREALRIIKAFVDEEVDIAIFGVSKDHTPLIPVIGE